MEVQSKRLGVLWYLLISEKLVSMEVHNPILRLSHFQYHFRKTSQYGGIVQKTWCTMVFINFRKTSQYGGSFSPCQRNSRKIRISEKLVSMEAIPDVFLVQCNYCCISEKLVSMEVTHTLNHKGKAREFQKNQLVWRYTIGNCNLKWIFTISEKLVSMEVNIFFHSFNIH